MVDMDTKVLGIIGYPLEHSLSPLLHNHAFQDRGLNYVYLALPLDPEELKEGIGAVRTLNIRGINVTIPFKVRVLPFLDELDTLAEEIGAVNTIVNNDGKLTGYNTDCSGFQLMLERDAGFQIKGKKAVIIGAGGASRAVGTALANAGIEEIRIFNRNYSRAEKLATHWRELYQDVVIKSGELKRASYEDVIRKADLLIDTTPVGMNPRSEVKPVVEKEILHSGLLVADLVYDPRETTLLRAAREEGAQVVNGLSMLLYQAVSAFKLWTGREPDLEKWRKLVDSI